jgi:hypothetical protein
MSAMKLPKLLAATALAVTALSVTPLAQAAADLPPGPNKTSVAATADVPPGPGKTSVAKPPWDA